MPMKKIEIFLSFYDKTVPSKNNLSAAAVYVQGSSRVSYSVSVSRTILMPPESLSISIDLPSIFNTLG